MASFLRRKARAGLGVSAELYIPEHLITYQPTRRFTVAVSEGESIETWDAEIHEEKIADPTDGMFPEELIAFTRFFGDW